MLTVIKKLYFCVFNSSFSTHHSSLFSLAQFKDAVHNIFAARLRSFLAILGILVGTASVVAMVSGGQLATRAALMQFKSLGTDLFSISVNMPSREGGSGAGSSQEFGLNEAMNLRKISPDILKVAPYTTLYGNIVFLGKPIDGNLVGVTDDFFSITKIKMHSGRKIFTIDKIRPFGVVGSEVYAEMKKLTLDPLRQQLRFNDSIITVVGVTKPWGENSFLYFNADSTVFIPILKSKVIGSDTQISNIILQLKPNANIDKLSDAINDYFAKNYVNSRVYLRSAKQFIDSMAKQQQIFTIFLAFIGGISLLVGGIGIMNIMLVSVTERRREIGVRMAIGAKRADIRNLFMFESLTLSLIGGLSGIFLGIILSFIVAIFKGWGFSFFLMPPLIGFSVSVLTGIFFGSYPAYKASKLDPIETLRSE